MKYFKTVLCVFVCFLLQTAVFRVIFKNYPVPNLIFTLALCMSMVRADWFYAAMVSVGCGMVLDFSSQSIFGVCTVFCMACCVLAALVQPHFNKAKAAVNIILVFVFSFVYELLYYIFCFVIWSDANMVSALVKTIIPTAALNALFSLVMFKAAGKLSKKDEDAASQRGAV